MTTIYDFEAATIDGRRCSMAEYRGRVLLVVNTASRCSLTPQYAGLEEMYKRHAAEGLTVLGFPCNQFMRQEPGNAETIQEFCSLSYRVTFPLFEKIDVNGPRTHPLYKFLKSSRRGFLGSKTIKWNFTKFLVDRAGRVVKRYGPIAQPERIERDVVKLLGQPEARMTNVEGANA